MADDNLISIQLKKVHNGFFYKVFRNSPVYIQAKDL